MDRSHATRVPSRRRAGQQGQEQTTEPGEEIEAAGLTPISAGWNTRSADGWIALENYFSEPTDLADGTWSMVYERDRFESVETGVSYEAYSQTEALTVK
ncbi:MAG: hypothetical protein Q4C85_00055 [Actinomyces sp.]|uniref:hypothetical protein n=1 Tax=Actinomyces sp. TaxID=29317 RepID=UPI0026DA729E|nr:hypothetical protein [Actinomyces sp.]MDO4242158.1 hypothetical protein [Actinomyces sp.]